MRKQLDIGDRKVVIGDKCIITRRGQEHGFGPRNVLLNIWGFKESSDETLIGLQSPLRNKGWADLDGNVPSRHGLWVTPSNFMSNMLLLSTKYRILEFMFRNRKLNGFECRLLHKCVDGNAFVEVDKNVGGGSCDGLGKDGHCIILPFSKLKIVR